MNKENALAIHVRWNGGFVLTKVDRDRLVVRSNYTTQLP